MGAIPTDSHHCSYPISWEQGSTELLQHAPDRSAQTLEGLLERSEVRQLLEAQALPEAGHLLKPIDELPVSDAQLDLEAVEHHQLGLGEGVLGELRAVGRHPLSCQSHTRLGKLEQLGGILH